MSYDLSLYRPEFLRHAIATNLGDWTNADPFPFETSEAIISHLKAHGYVEQSFPWLIGRCFSHPCSELQIEVNLYQSSLSFSVANSPRSAEAIDVTTDEAHNAVKLFGLAFCDPASGQIIT